MDCGARVKVIMANEGILLELCCIWFKEQISNSRSRNWIWGPSESLISVQNVVFTYVFMSGSKVFFLAFISFSKSL